MWEGVADHAYACADGLGHMGALVTYLGEFMGVAPQRFNTELEMARILMLVVCGSLLSFGKLSVLVNQVLASIQF